MIIPDTNLLIYAFRKELPQHPIAIRWLKEILNRGESVGISVMVELAFLRLMTKTLGELPSASWDAAWKFLETLLLMPEVSRIHASFEHSKLFARLCRSYHLTGDRLPDAYLAALALENHAVLASADQGFGRYQDLLWINPLREG